MTDSTTRGVCWQELQLNLSLNYNQRRGYHFVLPAAEREIAERSDFIQLQTHGKQRVSCSTEELAQLNMRCQDMISQILMTTEQAFARGRVMACGEKMARR